LFFLDHCEQIADFRAQQCQHLFEVVSMDFMALDLQLDQVLMVFNLKSSAGTICFKLTQPLHHFSLTFRDPKALLQKAVVVGPNKLGFPMSMTMRLTNAN
jgi:hypothetical protein